MNANEQIKMIHSTLFEIANIIKHQQAEIEALKAYKEAYKILWDERNERK